MNYDSKHILFPFPNHISPYGTQIMDMRLAGISPGTSKPLVRAQPPQSGQHPMLSHDLMQSPGADCPSCNLTEIPYNPNLPVLSYVG